MINESLLPISLVGSNINNQTAVLTYLFDGDATDPVRLFDVGIKIGSRVKFEMDYTITYHSESPEFQEGSRLFIQSAGYNHESDITSFATLSDIIKDLSEGNHMKTREFTTTTHVYSSRVGARLDYIPKDVTITINSMRYVLLE